MRYSLNFKQRLLITEECPKAVLNLTRWLESVDTSIDSNVTEVASEAGLMQGLTA